MKTLFYSLLTFAFALSNFAAQANSFPPMDEVGPHITIDIELGKKSRDCARIGICHVTIDAGIGRQTGPKGENTASGTAWIENGKLKIAFDRASMTAATLQTHFGNGRFQLEEDFVLPKDVAMALGVNYYIVKTGVYALPNIAAESDTIQVTF